MSASRSAMKVSRLDARGCTSETSVLLSMAIDAKVFGASLSSLTGNLLCRAKSSAQTFGKIHY